MRRRIGVGSAILSFSLWSAGFLPTARAEEPPQIAFDEVWALAQKESPSLQAARHEVKAAQIGKTRAGRHWYPHINATGKVFSTDDPATTFMSVLGQRQISTADFLPDALNDPGSNLFQHATLGLDLPLYEGGMSTSMAAAAAKTAEAKIWAQKDAQSNEFAALASDYASLLVLEEERTQLGKLGDQVSDLIQGYEVGSKDNPVGYSGLLGLKTLRNRVAGLLAANEALAAEHRSRIQTLAGTLPAEWKPDDEGSRSFLNRILPTPVTTASETTPASVKAAQDAAEAQTSSQGAERAKFLPKVGAFAQGDVYGGSRATAWSYTAGAYLNWQLFAAPNFGAVEQASESAAAARERARALRLQLQNQALASRRAIESLEKSLTLLDQSADLLEEQTETARSLFLNGSITALQLVEVLARRADLVSDRTQAELSLASARSALYLTSGASPGIEHEGQSHE